MIGVYIGAGMCNRIFQMVFAYCFARKHQIGFRFEGWNLRNHHSAQLYEWLVQRFMDHPLYVHESVSYQADYREPGEKFTHCLDVFAEIPFVKDQPVLAYGFFQNEGYFLEYKEDIQLLLREPEYITQKIQTQLASYLPHFQEAFFLHIRLGDYIHLPKHWIDLENYYLQALEQVYQHAPDAPIVIFCNDPEKMVEKYPRTMAYLSHKKYMVVRDPDEVLHFYLMIRCRKGGICSNSTFGWWASWLNTSSEKRVYMPNRWINGEEDIQIYPSWAILLDVDKEQALQE